MNPLKNMKARLKTFSAALALALSTTVQADPMPHASIKDMCKTADLIVTGIQTGDGRLQISEVFKADAAKLKTGDVVKVDALKSHSRHLFDMKAADGKGEQIGTKQLVLFAKYDELKQLKPVLHFGQGSMGVIWFDAENCYGYMQMINPGGYVLVKSGLNSGNLPHGKADLRKQLAAGIQQHALEKDKQR